MISRRSGIFWVISPAARQCSSTLGSVGGAAGSAGTTNATTISPRSASGMPSTATSAIVGMAVEHVLDLLGRDVLALADDDVLDPAGDEDRAVRVEAAEVAGVQEAVGGERVRVE